MGGSSSKATSEIINEQKYTNKNLYESVTTKMNEAAIKAFQKASKNSEARINTNQTLNMGNIIAAGKGSTIKSDISQTTAVTLNFEGVQSSVMKADIIRQASQVASDILKNEFTLDTNSNLKSKTESSANTGVSLGSFSKSNTDNKVTNRVAVENEVQTKINNFLSNKLDINIKQEDVQTCMNNLSSSQDANYRGMTAVDGGVIDVDISQSINLDIKTKCTQISDAIASSVDALLQSTEVKTENKSNTVSRTDISTESKSSAKSGIDIGFGSFGSSAISNIIIIIIIIIVIVYLIYLIITKFFINKKSPSQENGDETKGNTKNKINNGTENGTENGTDNGTDNGTGNGTDNDGKKKL